MFQTKPGTLWKNILQIWRQSEPGFPYNIAFDSLLFRQSHHEILCYGIPLGLGVSVVIERRLVRHVMSRPAITVEPMALLLDAALTLRSSAIRHLPVVENGQIVGLLTDRDIQRCAPSRLIPISEDGYNQVFAGTTVSRVMTREPLSVGPDLPLSEAIVLMQQSRYGCLPVVENGAVVGILTRSDLVDALQRLLCGQDLNRFSADS
jgi:CBS domain-containing protein